MSVSAVHSEIPIIPVHTCSDLSVYEIIQTSQGPLSVKQMEIYG